MKNNVENLGRNKFSSAILEKEQVFQPAIGDTYKKPSITQGNVEGKGTEVCRVKHGSAWFWARECYLQGDSSPEGQSCHHKEMTDMLGGVSQSPHGSDLCKRCIFQIFKTS